MKQIIIQKLNNVISKMGIQSSSFTVEYTSDLKFGDYSSNIAMVIAKNLNRNPHHLASEIIDLLDFKSDDVEKIEIAGPGFINFFISRSFLKCQIASAVDNLDKWVNNTEKQGELVLFEYTSPNLFKPLHIGNLVGNIVGESLSRLLENAGAKVCRVNYPSDIGLTVAKGVWGLIQTKGDPDNINALGDAYRYGNEKYENDQNSKIEIDNMNGELYKGTNQTLNDFRGRGIITSRYRLAELCNILGTKFDLEFFESQVSKIGVDLVMSQINKVFTESNGAIIFGGEKYGLHTRVFINSQGLPTYEAKDLGNFLLKARNFPDWTSSIIVTGSEQMEYFKVIFKVINCIFPETSKKLIKHVPTGFLTLTTGKMSSRKGNVLSGESLLEEVRQAALEKINEENKTEISQLATDIAVAALKYQILRQKVGNDIVFDKQRALSFEGDSGPYLQYTHARIVSVLKRADELGLSYSVEHHPEYRYDIEGLLFKFPNIISTSTEEYSPHKLAAYLVSVASEFNRFYANEKIADPTDQFSEYKIAITLAVKGILKKGLYLLGIVSPDSM